MDELTVIIPTLNEEHYVGSLLNSIAKQQAQTRIQVIVVDGQSTDKTRQKVENFKSKLDLSFITTSPDVGHQRNVGVEQAKYEYLLFLDADVILPPGCLQKLSKAVDGRHNFIATTLHLTGHLSFLDAVMLSLVYFAFFLAWLVRTPVINGDFILTTKTVHRKIDGFKEGAILGEDTDYGLRACRAGSRYQFIKNIYILASDRRVKQTGRLKLMLTYGRAFMKVRKSGPTYEGIDFSFGHHGKPNGIKAVIFDFDGTIADSFENLLAIGQRVLRQPNKLTNEELEKLRDMTSRQVIKELGIKPSQLPILAIKIRQAMKAELTDIRLFDGIPIVLRDLQMAGVNLYIVSANSTKNIETVLVQNDLSEIILRVYGNVGLFSKAKTLKKLLRDEKLLSSNCIYVGDETRDIEAAKAVGMQSIAVDWGFNSANLLQTFAPDKLVSTIKDLKKALSETIND